MTPCFAAQYAVQYAQPRRPAVLETLTMRPGSRRASPGWRRACSDRRRSVHVHDFAPEIRIALRERAACGPAGVVDEDRDSPPRVVPAKARSTCAGRSRPRDGHGVGSSVIAVARVPPRCGRAASRGHRPHSGRAMAAPIPRPPPVTSACWPAVRRQCITRLPSSAPRARDCVRAGALPIGTAAATTARPNAVRPPHAASRPDPPGADARVRRGPRARRR